MPKALNHSGFYDKQLLTARLDPKASRTAVRHATARPLRPYPGQLSLATPPWDEYHRKLRRLTVSGFPLAASDRQSGIYLLTGSTAYIHGLPLG